MYFNEDFVAVFSRKGREFDRSKYQLILPDDFGPVTINRHGHNGASLAGRQRQFPKFRLFDADLVITVKPTTPEIFAPVGVLIVYDQQREASIFVVRGPSGCT